MLRVITENNNGAKITEVYALVVEDCESLKLDPPSEATFYRRFKKHSNKAIEPPTVDKKKIEPVPVNKQKKKYREYMKAQVNDLSQKTGMYEGNDNAI